MVKVYTKVLLSLIIGTFFNQSSDLPLRTTEQVSGRQTVQELECVQFDYVVHVPQNQNQVVYKGDGEGK